MPKRDGAASLPFERSGLWHTAFTKRAKNRDSDICEFYAIHLRDLRDKARALVDRIRSDIPFLTIHDITHLDALWETASIIGGPSYPMTPAEGYVFGAAVLLHDAAMCLAAFPRGLADISGTSEWKDTVAMQFSEQRGSQGPAAEISNPPKDIIERTVPIVLRLLHAKQAEELPRRKWVSASADTEYLIENEELRDFYGHVIGKIARSHGEPMSWLRSEFGARLGPLASHDGGEVNGLKLACLLRAADAAQIDARRAPRFEKTILKPKGVSDLHWTFQGKLAKPRLEHDALVYTAGSPFSLAEADAWWLCFDAIQVADRELHDIDVALEDRSEHRFKARRVLGAQSPKDLAREIRTEGWHPIDAQLKVSNVPHLVKMFGGEHLYGDDSAVAIRELVQNAADAIRARRKLDPALTKKGGGEIVVRLVKRDEEYWLEVEDNGIGMSERTISGALLDFGRSFWATDAVRSEFPGLMATGMSPTGKFGIGFFSVFMLGDVVRVTSRRYDSALDDTRTLEFRDGLCLRPILRKAHSGEGVPGGGTKVAVLLRSSPYGEKGLLTKGHQRRDLHTMVGALCPSLDVFSNC